LKGIDVERVGAVNNKNLAMELCWHMLPAPNSLPVAYPS